MQIQSKLAFKFSDLPDQVAHHILSFLTLKDLAHFRCVSQKCRELYLTSPSLDFDLKFPRSSKKRVKVLNYMERFLLERSGNAIPRFRIRWVFFNDEPSRMIDDHFRIFSWIHNAVRSNVEVLDLDFTLHGRTELLLSSCIFLCRSLRSLLLNLHGRTLKLPSLSVSCNLHYMKLTDVAISDEAFFKWISCSCKCMKQLHLEQVHGTKNITLQSSSLESVTFVHLHKYDCDNLSISGDKIEEITIECEFDPALVVYPSSRSLHICAPNLKNFKWGGNLMDYHLGDLVCLENAEIFLRPKEVESDKLFGILCCIRGAKVLILNEETTKAMFKESLMQVPLDIGYLGIRIKILKDDLVPAVVSLLRRTTNLNTLSIRSDPSSLRDHKFEEFIWEKASGINMGYWKTQKLACICLPKEVRIEISDGTNELELARYLLEHAQNLQKMVILYSSYQSSVLRKISKSKMNSTTTLIFHKKQKMAGITKKG